MVLSCLPLNHLEIELCVWVVHFYGNLKSNKISILVTETDNVFTIKLRVHTPNSSSISLWWDFENGEEVLPVVTTLHKIISDIKTFSQSKFFKALETSGIARPVEGDNW